MRYKQIMLLAIVLHTSHSHAMNGIPCQVPDENGQLVTFYLPLYLWKKIIRIHTCERMFKQVNRWFRLFYAIRNANNPPLAQKSLPKTPPSVTIAPDAPPVKKPIDTAHIDQLLHELLEPQPLSSIIVLEGLDFENTFENRKDATVKVRKGRGTSPNTSPKLPPRSSKNSARIPTATIQTPPSTTAYVSPGQLPTTTTVDRQALPSSTVSHNTRKPMDLYVACTEGNVQEAIAALDNNITLAPLNLMAHPSPLHLAAQYGHSELIKALVSHGISPNVQADDRAVPIIWAIQNNASLDAVQTLHTVGASLTHVDDAGNTLLHTAAQFGSSSAILKYLLDKKEIPINQINLSGDTALTIVCQKGLFALAQILITHNADINKEVAKYSPCDIAYAYQRFDIVTLLLACGARQKIKIKDNALVKAITQKNVPWITALLGLHAPVTPEAIALAHQTKNETIIALVCPTAPVPPMYEAIEQEDIMWIRLLLQQQTVVTPDMVERALETHNTTIIDLLCEAAVNK